MGKKEGRGRERKGERRERMNNGKRDEERKGVREVEGGEEGKGVRQGKSRMTEEVIGINISRKIRKNG